MIAELIYILCALTSATCVVLLFRSYARTRVKLLFWSALCFVGLTLNNILLIVDRATIGVVDLSAVRAIPALAGVLLLLWGMIQDTA